MGADMYSMMEELRKDRGVRYSNLKRELCEILGLEFQQDVNGPGDDRGATDADVIDEIKRLVDSRT